MRRKKADRFTKLLAGLCIFALSTAAQASLVTLKQGESVTLNFDLIDDASSLPLDSVDVMLRFSQASGAFAFSAHDQIDGVGAAASADPVFGSDSTVSLLYLNDAGILDGVFSIVVTRVDGNPVRILSANAIDGSGTSSTPSPSRSNGIPGSTGTTGTSGEEGPQAATAMPLPASLLLLGIGFVALIGAWLGKRAG